MSRNYSESNRSKIDNQSETRSGNFAVQDPDTLKSNFQFNPSFMQWVQ